MLIKINREQPTTTYLLPMFLEIDKVPWLPPEQAKNMSEKLSLIYDHILKNTQYWKYMSQDYEPIETITLEVNGRVYIVKRDIYRPQLQNEYVEYSIIVGNTVECIIGHYNKGPALLRSYMKEEQSLDYRGCLVSNSRNILHLFLTLDFNNLTVVFEPTE